MSSQQTGHDPPGPHSAAADGQDDVDYGKVVGVGIASLVLFAVSIWWAWTILHSTIESVEAKTGKAKTFDLTRTEIGIVDQVPFVSDTAAPVVRILPGKGLKVQVSEPSVLTFVIDGSSLRRVVKKAGTVHIPWPGPARRVRVVAWDAAGNASAPAVRVRRPA